MNPLRQVLEFMIKVDSAGAIAQINALQKSLGGLKGTKATAGAAGAAAGVTAAGKAAQQAVPWWQKLGFAVAGVRNEKDRMRIATSGLRRQLGAIRNEILVYVFALGSLAAYLRSAIKAHLQMTNALTGLQSVARRTVGDVDAVTMAAKSLTEDGLMQIGDAATGLKNLLATGFSLPEATNLMKAFKDTAAFGRQGALEFGEAIRGATEGIKNQNSIMVDNAGVTKNLTVILREMGYSEQDLSRVTTDVNVRMALYKGLLKEAAINQGDAAILAGTLSGQLSKVSVESFRLKDAIGATLSTVVKNTSKEILNLLKSLREYISANKEVLAIKIEQAFEQIRITIAALIWPFTTLVGLTFQFGVAVSGVSAPLDKFSVAMTALQTIIVFLVTKKILAMAVNWLSQFGIFAGIAAPKIALLVAVVAGLSAIIWILYQRISKASDAERQLAEAMRLANAQSIDQKNRMVSLVEQQQSMINSRIANLEMLERENRLNRNQAKELSGLREEYRLLTEQSKAYRKEILAIQLTQLTAEIRGMGGKAGLPMLGGIELTSERVKSAIETTDKVILQATRHLAIATQNQNKALAESAQERIRNWTDFKVKLMEVQTVLKEITQIDKTEPLKTTGDKIKEIDKDLDDLARIALQRYKELQEHLRELYNEQLDETVKTVRGFYDALEEAQRAGAGIRRGRGFRGFFQINISDELLRQTQEAAANARAILGEDSPLAEALKEEANRLGNLYATEMAKAYLQALQQLVGSFQELGRTLLQPTVLKEEANRQINDLQKQLKRGEISQQEYAVRIRNIHKNLSIQISNVWRGFMNNFLQNFGRLLTEMVMQSEKVKGILAKSLLGGLIGFGVGFLAEALFRPRAEEAFDFTEERAAQEARRTRMGGIAAAPQISVAITPTVTITGTNIWIGAGTVQELETGLEEMIISTTKQAIEVGTISFGGLGREG